MAITPRYTQSFHFWRSGKYEVPHSLPLFPGTLRVSSSGDLGSIKYPIHSHYSQVHWETPIQEIWEVWTAPFMAIIPRYTERLQFKRSKKCRVPHSRPLPPGTPRVSSYGDRGSMKDPIHSFNFQVHSELPVQEIWEMWRNPSLPLLPGTLRVSSSGDLGSMKYPIPCY